ncbi:MAG: type II secretion system protein [Acidimicrobiales bacterium]|jgi:type IV pilus assembly protein PilA
MLKSMLRHLRDARMEELESEGAGEAGFTLIELMVVLLIIAILLAIAIPTFLGVTGSANDRSAQSNLTNALTEASAVYQNTNLTFPLNAAVATYQSSAPEFTWGATTAAANQSTISVDVSIDGQVILLATRSNANGGNCWFVVSSSTEAPSAGFTGLPTGVNPTGTTGTYYAEKAKNQSTCNASSAVAYANWGTSYGASGITN